jgi:hypothetical protein
VELAEYCAEYLRKEQERLLALLHAERRMLREEIEQEWEQHLLEIRRRGERLGRELSLARQEQERFVEELRRERAEHLEAQQRIRHENAKYLEVKQRALREREGRERERRARLDTEERIEQLEREIRRLQEAQRESAARESAALVTAESPEARAEARTEARVEQREPSKVRPSPAREARAGGSPKPPASPAGATKPVRVPPRDKKPGRGVWHPHPDDDTGKGKDMPEKRDRKTIGAPVEMFRKHYDKYLENYLGYVELAEELYRTRGDGKSTDGPFGEREWEERLRRILDGIERTTARLDILEQHNPELVTDARISHRASVARRHAQLP